MQKRRNTSAPTMTSIPILVSSYKKQLTEEPGDLSFLEKGSAWGYKIH